MTAPGRPGYKPLARNTQVDVCVVGAGIAGLTTAYLLLKEGKTVVVLDDGPVVSGETERTTAHAVTALDDRYIDLEKLHGQRATKLAAQSHAAAIDRIEKIVRDETIACGFRRLPGYLFLSDGESRTLLERELAAIHRAGLTGVKLQSTSPLPSFDTGPSLMFPDQAEFHPLQYLFAVCRAIDRMGGHIHTFTRATSVKAGPPCRVATESGYTVTSGAVVVATNAPFNDNALIYSRQAPYRTYVIGCQIPKGSVPHGLYWDTGAYSKGGDATPYHYVRVESGDRKDTLIVGGEDHRTGEHDDAAMRFRALETWAKRRFPMVEDITYRWSGQVLEPIDGLAMLGRKPGQKGDVFIITGDSGNGMTHCTIGAMLITDLIQGRLNPWAKLYDPSRVRPKSLKEFAKQNAHVAKTLVGGWVTNDPLSRKDKKDIGLVVREGVRKIALYIDEKGAEHRCSAVCPHKGCIVAWNGLEKSWDCPCHGSRYDRFGKLLTGPSKKDLKPV